MRPWMALMAVGALLGAGCSEDSADPDSRVGDVGVADEGVGRPDACGVGADACVPAEVCPREGLWALGDGRETALLLRLDPAAGGRVVSHRVPVDTCSLSAGRPGSGSARATFDAVGCTLAVESEASWCFSGEQQCRTVSGTVDLRAGTFAGTFDARPCGFPGESARTPVVTRLEACPFGSRLDEGRGPGLAVSPEPGGDEPFEYVGVATVAAAEDRADARQRVTLDTLGSDATLYLTLPAPLRLAVGDAVWVEGAQTSPVLDGGGVSAVVIRRGAGAPAGADPVWYAAARGPGTEEMQAMLARAGLGLAPVPACPLTTDCAPEATGMALAVVVDGAPAEPMAVPGEGFWLPADPELWVRVHTGIEGRVTQCTHTPEAALDFEVVRWPAPRF